MSTIITENEMARTAHLTRQLDLIDVAKAQSISITVIGCGAIGSFTVLNLAKMGCCNITHYDFDDVSVENMSNQFFRFKDINKNKSTALHELVEDFTKVRTTSHPREFKEFDARYCQGIVILAVDSMKARTDIHKWLKDNAFTMKLLIDARMSAEFYSQYAMNIFDAADNATYLKTLYSDGDAVQERCTAKSTIYTATLSAGLICKTVKNFIMNESYPRTVQFDIKSSQAGLNMFQSKG